MSSGRNKLPKGDGGQHKGRVGNHGNNPKIHVQSETPQPPSTHSSPQLHPGLTRIGENKIALPQIIPTPNPPTDGNPTRAPNSSPRTGNVAPGNGSMAAGCNDMANNSNSASISGNKMYSGSLKQSDIKPGMGKIYSH